MTLSEEALRQIATMARRKRSSIKSQIFKPVPFSETDVELNSWNFISPYPPHLASPDWLVPLPSHPRQIWKIYAYAQGKSKTAGLTSQEEEVLFQRYVHISDNWNAAKSRNNSDLNIVFINRPDENSVRTVHPNE